MNAPQEEAERRYLSGLRPGSLGDYAQRQAATRAFVSGAEWLAGEIGLTVEQVQRLGPLVEAARLVARADPGYWTDIENEEDMDMRQTVFSEALEDLHAAVAAIDGGTEAERPPESSS